MYIETRRLGKNGKIQHTIRESYREGKKVKKRTIANVTHLPKAQIEALKTALQVKGKTNQRHIISQQEGIKTQQGLSIGALYLIKEMAKRLGISYALGEDKEGILALWQVMARIIDQGSRLSASRLSKEHSTKTILGFKHCNEDQLYENLDWLAEKQEGIEDRLFKHQRSEEKLTLCLYDVTSSYLEGVKNELAAYGYNRDKKKGKMQIVIGLLCDQEGRPVSIQVFEGNRGDTSTVSDQIKKVVTRFGASSVVIVGDRGMLKGPQREELRTEGFKYITALSKPQIEALIKRGTVQLSLFEDELQEVEHEGKRYIIRRNPLRAEEIEQTRKEKEASIRKLMIQMNEYLQQHSKAKIEVAQKKVEEKLEKLKTTWLSVRAFQF